MLKNLYQENKKRIRAGLNPFYKKITVDSIFSNFVFLKINFERDLQFLFKKRFLFSLYSTKNFCNYTSRARGILTIYGMSRMQFKRFACLGFFLHLIKRGH